MSELIEKQKVLDALREIATEKFSLDDSYGVYINVLIDVEEKICRLPVVQPNGPDNLVKDSQVLAKDLANDTISRKAALDEVINLWADKPFGNPALVEIKDCIEKLPSAQPERMRGKWIEDDDGWDGVIWRCSECDAVFALTDGTPEENEYNFCPHCGADMREVDDDRPD